MTTKRKKPTEGKGAIFGAVGSRFTDWYGQNRYVAIGVGLVGIIALAVVVPVAIYRSSAATSAVSYEAENAQLGYPAGSGSDSSASGGSFVQFKPAGSNAVLGGTDTSCSFQKADQPLHVAFCEGFGTAYNNPASLNRSGDLQNQLWGVSRTNTAVNFGQGFYNNWYAATMLGCGAAQTVIAPRDVRVCNGRLQEAVNDGGGQGLDGNQTILAMYPKQPFDFAGRTGTIVFDVSADSGHPHDAWPEFWMSDQPVPTPYGGAAGQAPHPRNGFGFAVSLNCGSSWTNTGIDNMKIARNNVIEDVTITRPTDCVKDGSATGSLNHFEVRVSVNHIEVWATDAGSTVLKQIAVANNINLPLTKGLIWIEDAHYNACKDVPDHCDHTFAWDNVGFDGPDTYRDLSFDVPDANVSEGSGILRLGYQVSGSTPTSVNVPGVFRLQTPTSALVTFNWFAYSAFVPDFRVNGGPWHITAFPFSGTDAYEWRTIGIDIPVSETKDGTNTIEFRAPGDEAAISNINLILVAASPVPTR